MSSLSSPISTGRILQAVVAFLKVQGGSDKVLKVVSNVAKLAAFQLSKYAYKLALLHPNFSCFGS